MTNNVREKLNALIQACKDEGLNPRVNLWFHNHLQHQGFTEERAIEIITSLVDKSKESIKLDFETLGDGTGLISEYLPGHEVDIAISFNAHEKVEAV